MSPQTHTRNIGPNFEDAGVRSGQQLANRLAEAWYRTVSQVRKATDAALLEINGVGPVALKAIRKITS